MRPHGLSQPPTHPRDVLEQQPLPRTTAGAQEGGRQSAQPGQTGAPSLPSPRHCSPVSMPRAMSCSFLPCVPPPVPRVLLSHHTLPAHALYAWSVPSAHCLNPDSVSPRSLPHRTPALRWQPDELSDRVPVKLCPRVSFCTPGGPFLTDFTKPYVQTGKPGPSTSSSMVHQRLPAVR